MHRYARLVCVPFAVFLFCLHAHSRMQAAVRLSPSPPPNKILAHFFAVPILTQTVRGLRTPKVRTLMYLQFVPISFLYSLQRFRNSTRAVHTHTHVHTVRRRCTRAQLRHCLLVLRARYLAQQQDMHTYFRVSFKISRDTPVSDFHTDCIENKPFSFTKFVNESVPPPTPK